MLTLTALDRCDRCGAQALHMAQKPGKPDLLFCNHHYNEHKNALTEQYWLVEHTEPYAEATASVYSE